MVELLSKSGIEVTRQSNNYISVKLPESKKAHRLKGGIYNEQFNSIEELEKISSEANRRIKEFQSRDISKELEQTIKKLNRIEKKFKRRTKKTSLYKDTNNRTMWSIDRNAYKSNFKYNLSVRMDSSQKVSINIQSKIRTDTARLQAELRADEERIHKHIKQDSKQLYTEAKRVVQHKRTRQTIGERIRDKIKSIEFQLGFITSKIRGGYKTLCGIIEQIKGVKPEKINKTDVIKTKRADIKNVKVKVLI